MTCGLILSSIFSSIVVNRRHFLSNLNPDCNRQGIFSFFRRKLKNDRFFLVFFSNSEPSELVSDWDSSSTIDGRRECCEGLEVRIVFPDVAKDETLVLALLGKGGLEVSTAPTTVVDVAEIFSVLTLPPSLAFITVADRDELMDGCGTSDTLLIDAVAVAGFDDVPAIDAATAAMLDDASWLYDLTIVLPFGPIRPGVIFLAEERGGVPVALFPEEYIAPVYGCC